MDNELAEAIRSAQAAQKRAKEALDTEIEQARTSIRATSFSSDVKELEELDHLVGLLQAREWWRKWLK